MSIYIFNEFGTEYKDGTLFYVPLNVGKKLNGHALRMNTYYEILLPFHKYLVWSYGNVLCLISYK